MPCHAIYSKSFDHGTLYGLHLKGPKSDAALDQCIAFLDGMLSDCSPDKRTRFTSICNTPSLSGKIKTFAQGTHGEDMHFKALFSSGYAGRRELDPLQGVGKWTPSTTGNESDQPEEDYPSDASDTAERGSSSRPKRRAIAASSSTAQPEIQVLLSPTSPTQLERHNRI